MEKFVQESISKAESYVSKLSEEILYMEGMSGLKTRHFYNNLLEYPEDPRYLEIGTWKGSSVCSAMYNNKANVTCVDNFSEFNGPKDEFVKNLERYKGENSVKFYDSDCWSLDTSSLGKFNIYLYDGGHTYEDHYKALEYFYPCLDDKFVFIVDDWNWKPVRDGTFDAIKKLNLNITFQHLIRLTDNDTHTPPILHGQFTWHNGIGIFVLEKDLKDST